MVHITSVVMEKMQFNHFSIKSLWELSVANFGNQTKSQFTIILAFFKSPYQSNILTKLGRNPINGVLKVLTDGQIHRRTDDRQKVITIAHPEHSSGELKRIIKISK